MTTGVNLHYWDSYWLENLDWYRVNKTRATMAMKMYQFESCTAVIMHWSQTSTYSYLKWTLFKLTPSCKLICKLKASVFFLASTDKQFNKAVLTYSYRGTCDFSIVRPDLKLIILYMCESNVCVHVLILLCEFFADNFNNHQICFVFDQETRLRIGTSKLYPCHLNTCPCTDTFLWDVWKEGHSLVTVGHLFLIWQITHIKQ